jgi:hypothetical protein
MKHAAPSMVFPFSFLEDEESAGMKEGWTKEKEEEGRRR